MVLKSWKAKNTLSKWKRLELGMDWVLTTYSPEASNQNIHPRYNDWSILTINNVHLIKVDKNGNKLQFNGAIIMPIEI